MNYYAARQRLDNQRYDYTRMNDGIAHPEGYCREKILCPENPLTLDGGFFPVDCPEDCPTCHGKQRVANPDYCGSHDTAEDAEVCFAKYIADQGTKPVAFGDWTGCEVCDAPTKDGIMASHPLGGMMALCDTHRNYLVFKAHQPQRVGQITASW
jgi:hypothetical protein